jgi:hypothetical protein
VLPEQLEPGKRWIEAALRTFLQETSTRVEGDLGWLVDPETVRCTLKAKINGEQKSWKFSYEDVSDCLKAQRTQRKIQRQLRARPTENSVASRHR